MQELEIESIDFDVLPGGAAEPVIHIVAEGILMWLLGAEAAK